jgi:hypothetical protein
MTGASLALDHPGATRSALGEGAQPVHTYLTALHLAVAARPPAPKLVEALIRLGADPAQREPGIEGHTAWTLAALIGARKDVVEALGRGAASAEARARARGVSPISNTTAGPPPPKSGRSIDALNVESRAPLHIAYERANPGLAHLLIELGADPVREGPRGRTPLHMAGIASSVLPEYPEETSGPHAESRISHIVRGHVPPKGNGADLANIVLANVQAQREALVARDRLGELPITAAVRYGDPQAVAALVEAHQQLTVPIDDTGRCEKSQADAQAEKSKGREAKDTTAKSVPKSGGSDNGNNGNNGDGGDDDNDEDDDGKEFGDAHL